MPNNPTELEELARIAEKTSNDLLGGYTRDTDVAIADAFILFANHLRAQATIAREKQG